MSVATVVDLIVTGLLALAEHAPAVAAAFTGGRPVEEAIADARAAAAEIPVRSGPGGTWTEDLERRLGRG